YNGSIFAYGQTGSGKTFTMQGPETEMAKGGSAGPETEMAKGGSATRGLIPRALEYLFDKIAQKRASAKTAPAVSASHHDTPGASTA
ncbi:hypothetical protein T484DRAFT_1821339, partial [Baffinella frigidus]